MTTPLAADLGHLAAPPQGLPFDEVRMALLDAILAAKASGQITHDSWEVAFGAAVRSLRLRVLAEAETMLRAAATRSRYPASQLQALLPDAETADTLLHRLLAEGMPLERFEGFATDPVTRRARAAALEVAWEGAVRVAIAETARWRTIALQVAAWRRSTVSLWIGSAALFFVALLLAAWLGGDVPSPHWFRPVNDLWWRLWP